MEHLKLEWLQAYLDASADEQTQEKIEGHLDTCGECFEAYLELMEGQSFNTSLPKNFTDQTVEKIADLNQSKIKTQTSSYKTNKVVVNYFLAAGLTLILMLTGVFQDFLTISDITIVEEQQSLTDQLMNKTNGILDQMKGEFE